MLTTARQMAFRGTFCVAALAIPLVIGRHTLTRADPIPLPPTVLPPAPVSAAGPVAPAPLAQPASGQIIRFIRVTGYGVQTAKPSEVHMSFLISTVNGSAVAALQENARQMAHVVADLKDKGVPGANIDFSESSLAAPAHSAQSPTDGATIDTGDNNFGVPTQYTASGRINVVTYDISHASAIVQIGMAAGATSVLGMSFEPNKPEELKQEALVKALRDAASKAAVLALGVKAQVLYAISVSELPAAAPEPPGLTLAPPAELSIPISIEVVYAIN